MIDAAYPPLTASLIRRGPPVRDDAAVRLVLSPALAEDARLFLTTWAAGFAFILVFLF